MHSPPAPGAPSVAAASQAHFGSAVHSPHDTKVRQYLWRGGSGSQRIAPNSAELRHNCAELIARQYSVHSEPVISIEFIARLTLFIVLAGSSYSPHAGSSK